jgi:hypothetical protein
MKHLLLFVLFSGSLDSFSRHSPNGIAHARTGYVVISEGKRPVYLDCNKRALKLPMVGWGWEVEAKQ